MKKSTLLDSLKDFPEDIAIDELMERIYILEKIEKGREQVKTGRTNSLDETRKKVKWLK